MEEKKFECGYCGTKYDSIYERSVCEGNCYKKEKNKIEKEKAEKLQKEKDARISEIDEVCGKVIDLIAKYNQDYKEVVNIKNEKFVDFIWGLNEGCRYKHWIL